MIAFHTLWGKRPAPFEIVTQIASIASWRRHYPLMPFHVYADETAREWLDDLGVGSLYDGCFALPACEAEKKECWAWPKMEAMRLVGAAGTATVSIDIDLVIWKPLIFNPGVKIQALHYDNGAWPVYHELRPLCKLVAPELNFDVQPVNASLLVIYDLETRNAIYHLALKVLNFMKSLSIKASYDSRAMTLEQLIPPAVALGRGGRVDVFENLVNLAPWRSDPENVMHLWGSKKIYSADTKAREALIAHLINKVVQFSPVHAEEMKRIGQLDSSTQKVYNHVFKSEAR